MPNKEYVVLDPQSELYLIAYNPNSPTDSLFGNLRDAVIYSTLAAAQAAAANIGGGTVGTVRPH